jgi:hypothetical protein
MACTGLWISGEHNLSTSHGAKLGGRRDLGWGGFLNVSGERRKEIKKHSGNITSDMVGNFNQHYIVEI